MGGASISFGAPMVLALLAGAKSQTRRIVKPQPPPADDRSAAPAPARCPYGVPGERLWVREAFRLPSVLDALTPSAAGAATAGGPWAVPIAYAADGARRGWDAPSPPGRLRSPLFMPRWASRLGLVVTAVRIERLRAISAADALAEGVDVDAHVGGRPGGFVADDGPIGRYRGVWERIHGAGAWQADPWVWVVTFRPTRDGVDRPKDGGAPPHRHNAPRPAHRSRRSSCAKSYSC